MHNFGNSKKLGRGAFDTKFTQYSSQVLLALLETQNVHSKCWNKWGGNFIQNALVIHRGIKLQEKIPHKGH